MTTDLELKRAVLRLRRGTVQELAEHASVGREDAESFIRRHLDIVELIGTTDSEIGSPQVWLLRSDAEEALGRDVERALLHADAGTSAEVHSAIEALAQALIKLQDSIRSVTKRSFVSSKDDILRLNRIRKQFRVLSATFYDLKKLSANLPGESVLIDTIDRQIREVASRVGIFNGLIGLGKALVFERLVRSRPLDSLAKRNQILRRCIDERAALRNSILDIEESSRNLKSEVSVLNVEEIKSRAKFISSRILVCRSIVNGLYEAGADTEIERSLVGRIENRVQNCLTTADVKGLLERIIPDYVGEWVELIKANSKGAVERIYTPAISKSAPIFLVDATAQLQGQVRDVVTAAARATAAQVIQLYMGELDDTGRRELLNTLSTHLSEAAAVTARFVFLIDSGTAQSREIARELRQWSGELALRTATISLPAGREIVTQARSLLTEGKNSPKSLRELAKSVSATGLIASHLVNEGAFQIPTKQGTRAHQSLAPQDSSLVLRRLLLPLWIDDNNTSDLHLEWVHCNRGQLLEHPEKIEALPMAAE